MNGKNKFTQKDIDGMKKTQALKAADRNPFSCNMDYYEYTDGNGYEARFTKCGICVVRIVWVKFVFSQSPTFVTILTAYPVSLSLTAALMLAALLCYRPTKKLYKR